MKKAKSEPFAMVAVAFAVLCIAMMTFLSCNDDSSQPASSSSSTAASAPSASGDTAPASTAPDEGGPAAGTLPEDDDSDLPEDDGPEPIDVAPSASGQAPPAPKVAKPTPTPKVTPTPVPAEPAPLPTPEPAPKVENPKPVPVTPDVEPAKKGSPDEVADRIDAIFGPVKNFRARFNQKYVAKIHGKAKTSKGILYVLKPGKLSLSYHKPNRNRAVSDGTTLKVYEHENKQLFIKNVTNTEYPGAFAFILGKGLRKSFTFKFHKNSKWEGGPVLVGTPRVPNPGYKKVLFYIDNSLLNKGDLGAVRRVLVIDAQGNRNRFDFIHAEQPDNINPTEFTFEPPKGTEIIKG